MLNCVSKFLRALRLTLKGSPSRESNPDAQCNNIGALQENSLAQLRMENALCMEVHIS